MRLTPEFGVILVRKDLLGRQKWFSNRSSEVGNFNAIPVGRFSTAIHEISFCSLFSGLFNDAGVNYRRYVASNDTR